MLFFYRSLLFRFSTLVCSVGRRSYTTAREGASLFAPVHLLYGLVIDARLVWLHTASFCRSYFLVSALAYFERIEDHDMEPSSSREPPWAEHEKVRTLLPIVTHPVAMCRSLIQPLQVYLLAEVLKAAPIPSHVLFQFIRDANIQPRWNDMALPPGMFGSLHSRQQAYSYNMTRNPHTRI